MQTHSSDTSVRHWATGDHILLRYRRLGPVSHAMPVTVVHDCPDYTSLYLRPGTTIKNRVMPDGSAIQRDLPYSERAKLPHVVGDGIWQHNHALIVFREGEAHDVRLFWAEDDWAFRGWYVNLQEPVKRVPVGFDTADHVLDLAVGPDCTWSWKDEREMAKALTIGRFSAAEAEAIRAEGERVIPDIETRHWPFEQALVAWRPDPTWPTPIIPANWNED